MTAIQTRTTDRGPRTARYDVERIRKDFPILHRTVRGGKPLVYLDNAATTQKPQAMIDRIVRYYSEENSNVHRGVHYLSEVATAAYEDARDPMMAWVRQVKTGDWANPASVKRDIRTASILKDGRVVFNVAGNKYRIVVWINYPYRVVYIRFVGTHEQYDAIDAQTV